eukprot:1594202-Prymnesium_polylepis.1
MAPKAAAPPKAREGVAHAPAMRAAVTGATEAVCGLIDASEPVEGHAKVRRLTVDVGAEQPLTIATKWDVSAGMRVVIAVLGSF